MKDLAYHVPFLIDRNDFPTLVILNVSDEIVYHLRFSLSGPGVFSTTHQGSLAPGESAEVLIRGADLSVETLLTLRWFRPGGQEYLWHIAF